MDYISVLWLPVEIGLWKALTGDQRWEDSKLGHLFLWFLPAGPWFGSGCVL